MKGRKGLESSERAIAVAMVLRRVCGTFGVLLKPQTNREGPQ